jgi:purine-nucleoside phosphorylase
VATAEGTYAWVSGPTYETAAEGRFLRAAGADVVGMSTIPEVVASREEGMEVLVLSLVTNEVAIPEMIRSVKAEVEAEVCHSWSLCRSWASTHQWLYQLAGKPLDIMPVKVVSHEEVLIMGMAKAGVVKSLVERVVTLIGRSPSIT